MADYTGNGGSNGTSGNAGVGANTYDGPIVGSLSASGTKRTMAQITDGTSNTLLIGEKFLTISTLNKQPSCNDDQGYVNGWDNDMIVFSQGDRAFGTSPIALTNPPVFGQSVPPKRFDLKNSTTCGGFFGSIHHSGMSAAFCDGTVRTVPYNLLQQTFFSMCAINDGASFTLPD